MNVRQIYPNGAANNAARRLAEKLCGTTGTLARRGTGKSARPTSSQEIRLSPARFGDYNEDVPPAVGGRLWTRDDPTKVAPRGIDTRFP
jgi:hypothetical protein